MICTLCSSADNKVIYNYARFEKHNILKCNKCGLVFLETDKSREEIEQYYKSNYRRDKDILILSPEELYNDPVVQQDCRKRLEWLKSLYGSLQGKRTIEIGSASGAFLKALKDAGAEVTGIEYNMEQVSYSRSLGLDIYPNSFQTAGFENLDLVIMFHTLEHIIDPVSLVRNIYAALKLGGKFIGEVPNQDDWRIRIFDCNAIKRFHYDPCHYYYYSPITIRYLLWRAGFLLGEINHNTVVVSTVERYNSLLQLRRILTEYYDNNDPVVILKHDIFTTLGTDMRLENNYTDKEKAFNSIFEKGLNSELKGNCLRWEATR